MDCDRSLAAATPSPVKSHGEEPSSPTPSKRLHLQTSGKRACIVFHHRDIDERMKYKVEYSICIVDLDSDCSADAFIPIIPTLQYESESEFEKRQFSSDAFCVFGETLYIFEGTCQIGDSCKKSVFTFDLSSLRLDSTSLKLDKTNLVKIGEMGSQKQFQWSFQHRITKKFVVLPSNTFPFRRCDTIELYDSVSRTWEELPPLEVRGLMLSRLSYGFINECTLLIEITRGFGMYVLDLTASNKQWVHVDRICCDARRIPSYHGASNFLLIEDRFCFSDTAAFDLQAFSSDLCYDELSCAGGFSWPFVALPTGFGLHPYHSAKGVVVVDGMIAFLSYNQQLGEVDYCQLRVERLRLPQYGYRFIIDVCRSDLNAYIDDYEKSRPDQGSYITGKLIKTAIVKSYKFSLTLGQQKRQLWPPHSFFCF